MVFGEYIPHTVPFDCHVSPQSDLLKAGRCILHKSRSLFDVTGTVIDG